ncbi:MAG: TRAP transporter large permease [Firmicutes bacterium]|nr:TRAP transporter large permease [Bacillota bacterium]
MGISIVVQLLVLLGLTVPVGFALGYVVFYYFLTNGVPMTNLVQTIGQGINNFTFLAVPFYIMAGHLMNTGGMTNAIFGFANALVGHIKGGLAHVNILNSMIFAGMSGAAVADAAGLGMVEIRAMLDNGYDLDYAVAVTAASSTIGPIIPPSIIMVVFGITANVSIGRLFLGGIVPGIMMGVGMLLLNHYFAVKRDFPVSNFPTLESIGSHFRHALPALVLPLIIIGGIMSGLFTPTEAGCIAAMYALVLGVVTKEISFEDLKKIALETMLQSAQVGFIVATAAAFSWVLTFEQVPAKVAAYLTQTLQSPLALLIALNFIYLFLGCIMEASAIVIMTVPIVMPIAVRLGIDPIHLGVLVAINMSIGTLTPPVGIVMYVLTEVAGITVQDYTKAMLPWLGLLFGLLLLFILFPPIITWLPNMLM